MPNRSGEVLDGYELQSLIRSTRYTELYSAVDLGTPNKRIVLILLLPVAVKNLARIARYHDLAKISYMLPNSRERERGYTNLLKCLRYNRLPNIKENRPYLVYENIEDSDLLSEYVVKQFAVPDLFRKILEGVSLAHRHGLAHGALHSQNIYMREFDGRPKLFGFGLDAWVRHSIPCVQDDLYALGLILYALRRNIPFDEKAMEAMKNAGTPADLNLLSANEENFVRLAIQGNFSSADDMLDAFNNICRGVKKPVSKQPKPSFVSALQLSDNDIAIIRKTITRAANDRLALEQLEKMPAQNQDNGKTDVNEQNQPMRNEYLKMHFEKMLSDLLAMYKPSGDESGLYPSPAEYKRLCAWQCGRGDGQPQDGDFIDSGGYSAVCYRKHGDLDTVWKIYDLQRAMAAGNKGELFMLLESARNEMDCMNKQDLFFRAAKFYPQFSTPVSEVELLAIQVGAFYHLDRYYNDKFKFNEQKDGYLHKANAFDKKWGPHPALNGTLTDWLSRLIDAHIAARNGANRPAFDDFIQLPKFVLVVCEFGLTYSHYMRWLMQTPDYNKYVVSAICDLFIMLEGLHIHNIIHTDIKPENIILAYREGQLRPVVIDFNTSHKSQRAHLGYQHTVIPYFCGTDFYLPFYLLGPGAKRQNVAVTAKVDVYSMGLIACQFLHSLERDVEMKIQWSKSITANTIPSRISSLMLLEDERARLWEVLHRCLSLLPEGCPTSSQVVTMLRPLRNGHIWRTEEENALESIATLIKETGTLINKDRGKSSRFKPSGGANGSPYPDTDEYTRLRNLQISPEKPPKDGDFMILDDHRAIRYKLRNGHPVMQTIYTAGSGWQKDRWRIVVSRLYDKMQCIRNMSDDNLSCIIKIDFDHSTQLRELQAACQGGKLPNYVVIESEFGLFYPHYLEWLSQTLPERNRTAAVTTAAAMKDVGLALHTLHSSSMAHGNPSLHNLMLVRRDGCYKPVWFGMANSNDHAFQNDIKKLGEIFYQISERTTGTMPENVKVQIRRAVYLNNCPNRIIKACLTESELDSIVNLLQNLG